MRGRTGSIRRVVLVIMTFILVAGYPFSAMADTQEQTSPPPENTTTSEPQSTNSSGDMSKDGTTTNALSTTQSPDDTPKQSYTFNKETNKWESDKWKFNPVTNRYEQYVPPVIIEPEVSDKESVELNKDIDSDVTLNTDVISKAVSGDAMVFKNTTGGSALSGDATAVANVLNVVNSTIGTSENQKVAQFTQDVLGDVKGDIILSPLLLKAFLEAQAPSDLKTSVDVDNNFAIKNDMLLTAQSGNAGVVGNTTAGNAISGNATAVANVVNVLNSMIASQQSFIGTINIYGNLEGDILVAPDFIPQMIANNGGNSDDDTSLQVSSKDTQNIVNNISAMAESGAADVFGNTTAGSATSGDALSNVVIFNLSGHEVIAKNSLLVFVNVLGKWVGVIVDAPEGATAAMISNDVTKNATMSDDVPTDNGITNATKYTPDLTVDAQSSQGITNNIAVSAISGDAVVAHNTTAGNAVSGTAKAMANIANVTGSQFSATDWFGVLFINVYQNWYGSFGIDTPYGNPVVEAEKSKAPIEFRPADKKTNTTVRVRVIDSRAFSQVSAVLESVSSSTGESDTNQQATHTSSTLGTSTEKEAPQVSQDDYRLWIIAGSMLIIGLSVVGLKRLFN